MDNKREHDAILEIIMFERKLNDKIKGLPHWVIVALVAVGLRFVNLGSESLWYDEAFTAWLAKLPFGQMLKAVQGDVHPPTWYILEWFNIRVLGDSEFALRLPAALFGVALALIIWRIAAKMFEPDIALVAGLLGAAMPGILYYGQEARMYTMLAFFVMLALYAILNSNWILFSIACIGSVYSQNLGVFYVFALGLAAIWVSRDKPRAPITALIAVVVAWLPWGFMMIQQASAINAGFWITPLNLGEALFPLPAMTAGLRTAPAFQSNVYAASFGISGLALVIAVMRWPRRNLILILAIALGGPAVIAAVSVAWRSVYLFRALIPSASALCILWAYALCRLDKANRQVAAVICGPMFCIALVSHYFPGREGRESWRSWVQPVVQGWQAGDVLYYGSISPTILVSYYLPNYPYAMRPHSSDLNQSLSNDTVKAMDFREEDFDNLKSQYKRVWIVEDLNPLSRADEFTEIARILDTYKPTRVDVYKSSETTETKLWLVDFTP